MPRCGPARIAGDWHAHRPSGIAAALPARALSLVPDDPVSHNLRLAMPTLGQIQHRPSRCPIDRSGNGAITVRTSAAG
jgi:hypothetical protein